MIQLLFALVFAECALALLLCVDIPVAKKWIVEMLDQIKIGKGSSVVKTVVAAICVILFFNIAGIFKIRKRMAALGTVTPTDQILTYKYLLEISLMGLSLFLAIMIDRIQYNVRLLPRVLTEIEALRKQVKQPQEVSYKLEEENKTLKNSMESLENQLNYLEAEISSIKKCEQAKSEELVAKKEEIVELMRKLEEANLEIKAKEEQLKAAEVKSSTLSKQSEGFLLEYDCLLEDNQHLRTRLTSLKKFARSESNKF